MKKIYFGVITSIIASLIALSCSKVADNTQAQIVPNSDTSEDDSAIQEPATRTFTLKITDDKTKVAINGSTGKTTWEVGDQIFIHGQKVGSAVVDEHTEYYSTVVTLTAKDIDELDPSVATITVTDDMTYMPYQNRYLTTLWAAYPASAVMNYSNGEEWFYWNRFKNTNYPLMTGFNNLKVNDGNTFKFYNLCGVISFSVSGDFDSYVFSGNNSETVGYGGYQCRVHVYDAYNSSKVSDFEEKNIWNDTSNSYPKSPQTSIEVNDWTGADGTKVNYICIPGGASFANGFRIDFLKDGVITHYVTSSRELNMGRNDLVPLGNITGKLKTYVDPRRYVTVTPASYPSSVTPDPGYKMTIGDFDFYAVNARKKSSGIDVAFPDNTDGVVYNSTSLGKISKIVIKRGGEIMYNYFTVYGGTTSKPSTTEISGATTAYAGGGYSTITYDFSGGDYSHFAINFTNAYEGYFGDIEITYLSE